MSQVYDAIVVGIGGVGSAALMHLARRGLSVLGLDQFPPGHDRGSSHGQSRAIRQAYFEHPDYVPLLREAYQRWDELEQATRTKLFHRVGLLEVGPQSGTVVPGVLRSAALYGLDVDELSLESAGRLFPGFHIPAHASVVFERNAGFLLVEDCVRAHVAQARALGAQLHTSSPIVDWRAEPDRVAVRTRHSEYHAARLIITTGAWAGSVLSDLKKNLPLRVLRKHLHWYTSNCEVYRQDRGCPVYFFELGSDFFYGFPQVDRRGVKVAEHSGGEAVDDPLTASREQDPRDRQRVDDFVSRYLPRLGGQHSEHAVCFYTMSPDQHFIIDRHPEYPQVALAAGLSGHGFKFTPVLGQILADLVVDGHTALPIEFLRMDRFGGG